MGLSSYAPRLVNRAKRYRWQREHVRHPVLAEADNLRIGLGLSV